MHLHLDTKIPDFNNLLKSSKENMKIKGRIFVGKKSCDVHFSFFPFADLNLHVLPFFNHSYNCVYITPDTSKYSVKISGDSRSHLTLPIKSFIPKKEIKSLKNKREIKVVIPLDDFHLNKTDTIIDKDAQILAKNLLESGWKLVGERRIRGGDLSIKNPSNKKYLIEITRETRNIKTNRESKRWDFTNRILGKILQTKFYSERKKYDYTIAVLNSCNKEKFYGIFYKCLKYLKVKVLWSDFKDTWEKGITAKIKRIGEHGNTSY